MWFSEELVSSTSQGKIMDVPAKMTLARSEAMYMTTGTHSGYTIDKRPGTLYPHIRDLHAPYL
jgi:hypothetical protein